MMGFDLGGLRDAERAEFRRLLDRALSTEHVLLYDATGQPIFKDSELWNAAETEWRRLAHQCLDDLLDRLPPDKIPRSTEELAETLRNLAQSDPRFTLDIVDGKLSLPLSVTVGQTKIKGHIPLYRLGVLAATAIGAWFARRRSTEEVLEQYSAPIPDEFLYYPRFLTTEAQLAVLQNLSRLDYSQGGVDGRTRRCRDVQFGFTNVVRRRKFQEAPLFPIFIAELLREALARCWLSEPFNQCTVNHCLAGASIPWHMDAQGFGEYIMVVNLGATARLQFRPYKTRAHSYTVTVLPGSLYVIGAAARWGYEHCVLAVKGDWYSVTFREVGSASA